MKINYTLTLLLIISLSYNFVQGQEKEGQTVEDGISCYACGLEEVDPEIDEPGTYGDFRKEGTPPGKKMYNHTCDIADETGLDDQRWVRKCPEGVKSCFWAKGNYEKQIPVFRGCADAQFAFDEGCSRELQAVQVIAGKKSVDVEIFLCFCNSEKCNTELSSAFTFKSSLFLIVTTNTILKYIL